jgi:hypothetical protein
MAHISRTLGFLCASATVLAGCDSEDTQSRALTSWLGEQSHLAIKGTVQEKTFDVLLEGDDAGIYCDRFYTPLPGNAPDANGNYDTAQLYFAMKEIGAVIELEGKPTQFTISYWRHDLPTSSTLEVIPRTFGTAIPAGKTWSDINVFAPGADVLSGIESAAESGTVNIELNEGERDANGVMIPEGGRIGLFVDVSWGPGDWLTVSGTADCRAATMAPWAQSRILP